MSTVTLSPQKGLSTRAAVTRKGFFTRLYEAIIAAQMAKANREVTLYMQRTGREFPVTGTLPK